MMIPNNAVIEMLKAAFDFSNNVVSKFDDEKYAQAVITIYGHEPNYKELDELVELIKANPNTSLEDKRNLIFSVTDKKREILHDEFEYKRESSKIVNKGFEKKCKIAGKLFLGVATGGLSLFLEPFIRDNQSDEFIIEPNSKQSNDKG